MKWSLTPRSVALVALTLSMAFATTWQPAQAQYFNNMPYYLGSSLFYPISRLFLGGGMSMYNVANPYYMTNRLINGQINSSGIFRAPGYGANPMGVAGYTDEEPLQSPRQRNRPFRYGQYGYDQTSYAGGYIQPDPDAVVPQAVGQPGAPGMPAILPNQGMRPQISTQMPPLAPARGKHAKKRALQQQQAMAQNAPNAVPGSQNLSNGNVPANAANSGGWLTGAPAVPSGAASSAAAVASPAPLAQGFVSMVNSKYDGDISKALFSADGRSWAHTVGLIDNNEIFGADLSQERVSVIGKIFKDPGLDACSKLDAAKILLRTSAPATTVAGSSH